MAAFGKHHGVGLFFYGERYQAASLGELTTSAPSARRVWQALKTVDGATGAPTWVHLPEPNVLRGRQDFHVDFQRGVEAVRQHAPEVVLVYLVGHGFDDTSGAQWLHVADSNPDVPSTSVPCGTLMAQLADTGARHFVFVLEMCREVKANASGGVIREFWRQELRAGVESAVIISSTRSGAPSLGGSPQRPSSPFSVALATLVEDDASRLIPRASLEGHLRALLGEDHRRSKLLHTGVFVEPFGDVTGPLLAPYGVVGTPATMDLDADVADSGLVDRVARLIAERERYSFSQVAGLTAGVRPWQLHAHDGLSVVDCAEFLADNRNPAVVVGPSGAGKTILAKQVALMLAEKPSLRRRRIGMYLNSRMLSGAADISLVEVVRENLRQWRYDAAGLGVGTSEVKKLLAETDLLLLIDAVDELGDPACLAKLVNDCARSGLATPCVLCQPLDWQRVDPLLRVGAAVQSLELQPVSLETIGLPEAIRRFGSACTPRRARKLLEHQEALGHVPTSARELAAFEVASMADLLAKNWRGAAADPKTALRSLGHFAYEARVRTFVAQIPSDRAEIIASRVAGRDGPSLLEAAKRAEILVQKPPSRIVRFRDRQTQELLIADHWRGNPAVFDTADLLRRAGAPLWQSAIVQFALLEDSSHLVSRLAESSPGVAAECLAAGVEVPRETLERICAGLLAESTEWARSASSSALGRLPSAIRALLEERFDALGADPTQTAERVTIALALGRHVDSAGFLRERYSRELGVEGERASYLRRRILDGLAGRVRVDTARRWLDAKPDISLREWARVVRSVRLTDLTEAAQARALTDERCEGSIPPPLDALHTWREHECDGQREDDVRLPQIASSLIVSLRSTTKWHRAIGTLLLGAIRKPSSALVSELAGALLVEKDPHVQGDMAWALGQVGTEPHLAALVDIATTIDERAYALDVSHLREGLLNDVVLGICRLLDRHPRMELPPEAPPDLRALVANRRGSGGQSASAVDASIDGSSA